jgi:hypothetical protein
MLIVRAGVYWFFKRCDPKLLSRQARQPDNTAVHEYHQQHCAALV